jgi:hypothetical protein
MLTSTWQVIHSNLQDTFISARQSLRPRFSVWIKQLESSQAYDVIVTSHWLTQQSPFLSEEARQLSRASTQLCGRYYRPPFPGKTRQLTRASLQLRRLNCLTHSWRNRAHFLGKYANYRAHRRWDLLFWDIEWWKILRERETARNIHKMDNC